MKLLRIFTAALALMLMLTGCGTTQTDSNQYPDAVAINLSDSQITVDGVVAATDTANSVYIGHDIVYYEAGQDFTYGEGTEADAHNAESAAEHTVVHITQPGTYCISGLLTKGQVAVDLGDDAETDPNAVVTLILNGADITCEVAPAVIFYNVYECGSADIETATKDVDTSAAGANVIIADGSQNTVNGSYVARIYKPGSVVLNEAGTEVAEAKKLHKYDAAFYSKMSMNVNGEDQNTGVLTINAENEGLDSELHLSINGGIININSGNDGINTNEDGVSVTTINGGEVNIKVTGETGEGDGIDSNGWLVINGGIVTAQAYGLSMDSGIDSDMGIHINGGTVIASGNMLDRISESNQTYAVLNFSKFLGAGTYSVKNADNAVVLEAEIENSFTSLIISSADLIEGDYTLWYNGTQLAGFAGENGGMFGGGDMQEPPTGEMPQDMMPPEGLNGERPEMPPEGLNGERPEMPSEGFNGERPEMPEGSAPDQMMPDMEGMTPPEGFNGDVAAPPEFGGQGQGGRGGFGGNMLNNALELSEIFTIKPGANYFSFIETVK